MTLRDRYTKYGYYFPMMIAFLLSFKALVPVFIVLWLLSFFFLEYDNSKIKSIISNKWFYAIAGFFILHALGFLYASNKQEAGTSIEVKLSFLIFPILFFAEELSIINQKKIVLAFIAGVVSAGVFCFARGCYYYVAHGTSDYFYYNFFSYFMHPSYFSMYACFAALLTLIYFPKWFVGTKNQRLYTILIVVFLTLLIFLCASKIGYINYLLFVISYFVIELVKAKKYVLLVSMFASLIFSFWFVKTYFKTHYQRIETAIENVRHPSTDKTSSESTAVRKFIWSEASGIIRSNLWIGVSPGDANDKLYEAYQKNGLTGAYEKKLNAHNQYLQSFVGLGLIGFIVLVVITLGPLVSGVLNKNSLLIYFSLLVIINFLVESMLQTQAGVVFYAFFLCFLLRYNLKDTIQTTEPAK